MVMKAGALVAKDVIYHHRSLQVRSMAIANLTGGFAERWKYLQPEGQQSAGFLVPQSYLQAHRQKLGYMGRTEHLFRPL